MEGGGDTRRAWCGREEEAEGSDWNSYQKAVFHGILTPKATISSKGAAISSITFLRLALGERTKYGVLTQIFPSRLGNTDRTAMQRPY